MVNNLFTNPDKDVLSSSTANSYMLCMSIYTRGLYTHSGQVFLGHASLLSAKLNDLAHLQGDPVMVQLLCLPVQFGCVLCHKMLFVLPCRPCVKSNVGASFRHAETA